MGITRRNYTNVRKNNASLADDNHISGWAVRSFGTIVINNIMRSEKSIPLPGVVAVDIMGFGQMGSDGEPICLACFLSVFVGGCVLLPKS